MNTKTTLYLAVALAVLSSLYFLRGSQVEPADAETADPFSPVATASRDLSEQQLGDVVKVAYTQKDGDEWVFEKDTDPSTSSQDAWRMTSPKEMPCVSWEVDKFDRQLGRLQYELSYKPGEPGAVSLEDAGLDPPEATVSMTDADGKTITIEIGKPAPNRGTYVRLADSDEICVGRTDLSSLLTNKLLDYRKKNLWDFDKSDATRVEIVDRSDPAEATTYVFVKDGARWMIESPVTARATSKVDDMLTAMSRQYVMKWHDDDPSRLAIYGLKPAAWTVRVTVEEEVTPEPPASARAEPQAPGDEDEESTEDADAKTAEPEIKVTTYELHLSNRAPIGEDTKAYVRIGDDSLVATISKSAADKFKPVMAEWREMRIATENVQAATRIELTTAQASSVLIKKDGRWSFEPDGGRAEDSVVSALLKAISDLEAVVFIDDATEAPSAYGLDAPRAELRLTIPGVDHVERIAVGGFTDEKTRRLVYVRRNEMASVAKVRAPDVSQLIAGPRTYRDRTIVEVLPSRFERINLASRDGSANGSAHLTLTRRKNTWSLVEPITTSASEEQVDKLVESLGGLRAKQVVADGDVASAYGLHAPDVTLTLVYKPLADAAITIDDDDELAGPKADQAVSRTLELSVTEHDGKVYAKRSDRPTIYEVAKSFHTQLLAEYRTDRVWEFDDARVQRFSVRRGDDEHGFDRTEDKWLYTSEPDLPLDSRKVTNLLLQIRDLRTKRYVAYAVTDFSAYGLDAPAYEVTVTLEDDTSQVLRVSDRSGEKGTDKGLFANLRGRTDVFLLTADTAKRFRVNLDELE